MQRQFPVFDPQKYTGVRQVPGSASPSRTTEKIAQQVVKGKSRIEYVPFQKKVIDYVDQPRYKLVPKRSVISDSRDQVKVEIVPREVSVTDYYAVEHIRCYVPEIITERKMEYIPVQHTNKRYEYIPVERQIVHYPEHSREDEAPRYLGVCDTPKIYDNVTEQQIQFWEQQYGYVRGQSISELNRKIRNQVENQKQRYFQEIERQYSSINASAYQSMASHVKNESTVTSIPNEYRQNSVGFNLASQLVGQEGQSINIQSAAQKGIMDNSRKHSPLGNLSPKHTLSSLDRAQTHNTKTAQPTGIKISQL